MNIPLFHKLTYTPLLRCLFCHKLTFYIFKMCVQKLYFYKYKNIKVLILNIPMLQIEKYVNQRLGMSQNVVSRNVLSKERILLHTAMKGRFKHFIPAAILLFMVRKNPF